VKKLLNLFKPPVAKEKITDPEEVDKEYRYWRIRLFLSIYMGYTLYYFSRKSFTSIKLIMGPDLGLDKAELGLITTTLSLAYGVSKFCSGMLGDRSNARYFMSFGLILTGIFNLFFGMSSSLLAFAFFWACNGIFQGWGWPSSARLMTHWFSREERGTWWGIWSTAHTVGASIISLLGPIIGGYMGWRWAFYLPGGLCILAGLLLICLLRDTPESLGLPTIESYSDKKMSSSEQKTKAYEHETVRELSVKEILLTYVLTNRFIWILALAYFFIYILREGVSEWTNMYLVEKFSFTPIKANSYLMLFEVGGFVGTLLTGWLSDFFFRGYRARLCVFFSVAAILPVYGMWYVKVDQTVIMAIYMLAAGLFIYGPQMLIGLAAAELSHKKAAGTATGFVGAFAYAGGAVAGQPIGKFIDLFGWDIYFKILIGCGLVAGVILFPLWSVKARKQSTTS
jgi:MFS transporter, OPA family, sugar phosphate sensor protein UhpC